MPHLVAAIKSVQDQTLEDFEAIVSLDPSTDGSTEYCLDLKDPRFKIIRNSRPGLFSNLNNAILNSTGRYIQVFCQDDLMQPGLLADQLREIESWPDVSMVVARERNLDGEDRIGALNLHSLDDEPMSPRLYMWRAAHYASIASNLSSVMLSRAKLEQVGLFDESYRFAGDVELYNRIATVGRVHNARESHVLIRNHPGQTSRSLAAARGFIAEEMRIYKGFWRDVLPLRQWRAVVRFRAATRGAIHVRTGLREVARGRLVAGTRILMSAFRAYGVIRPLRHALVRGGGLHPAFEHPTIELVDVNDAARRAGLRGRIPALTAQDRS